MREGNIKRLWRACFDERGLSASSFARCQCGAPVRRIGVLSKARAEQISPEEFGMGFATA